MLMKQRIDIENTQNPIDEELLPLDVPIENIFLSVRPEIADVIYPRWKPTLEDKMGIRATMSTFTKSEITLWYSEYKKRHMKQNLRNFELLDEIKKLKETILQLEAQNYELLQLSDSLFPDAPNLKKKLSRTDQQN